MVVIVAGKLRRKLLLAKNEDLNFGYGVHSAALLAVLHNTSLIAVLRRERNWSLCHQRLRIPSAGDVWNSGPLAMPKLINIEHSAGNGRLMHRF